jgi:hypothetical protein
MALVASEVTEEVPGQSPPVCRPLPGHHCYLTRTQGTGLSLGKGGRKVSVSFRPLWPCLEIQQHCHTGWGQWWQSLHRAPGGAIPQGAEATGLHQ